MNDLKNKNIIVTGASGGIGNSIIQKLNEAQANILASGTKSEKLQELKSKFNKIKILKFDISQSENIEGFSVGNIVTSTTNLIIKGLYLSLFIFLIIPLKRRSLIPTTRLKKPKILRLLLK